MGDVTGELLRDRALQPFVTASLDDAAIAARGGAWVVLIDDGGQPVAAIPPGPQTTAERDTAAGLGVGGPGRAEGGAPHASAVGIVTADAATPVAAAVASAAFRAVDAGTPVVLLDAGRVAGVWAGPDLADALLHGAVRLPGATALPGRIDIPLIRRRCRVCGEHATFAERPVEPAPCPNSRGLDAHPFGW
jgi:hypothetical protein